MGDLVDLYDPAPVPRRQLRGFVLEPDTGSAASTFWRAGALASAPTAGGVAAFVPGAEIGGSLGSAGGPIGAGVGAIGGGLLASFGGAALVEKGQNWLLDHIAPSTRVRLGIDAETLASDEQYHPTARFLGSLAPQALFLRPGLGGKMAAAGGAAIAGGVEAGTEYVDTGEVNPWRVMAQAAIGATLNKNTRLGDLVQTPGHALVASIPRGVGETLPGIVAGETLKGADGIADEHRTPDERAAAHVVESEAMVRGSNPFGSAPEAVAAHGDLLAHATTAAAAGDAMPTSAIADRLAQLESGGNPKARNPIPGQTASGLGGFIDRTWVDGMRQWFPGRAKGKSDAELIAMKTDPVIGRQMLIRSVTETRKTLGDAGIDQTPGNVRLLHFLGPRRGLQLLRAPRDMPVSRFVPEDVIAVNERLLRGKTVGDVIGMMDAQMGGRPVQASVPQSAAADDGLGPAAWLDTVPREGPAGVSLIDDDGHFVNAVFRDDAGVAQGIVRMPTSEDGRALSSEVSSYVRPGYRRKGIATRLYDALAAAGHPVDEYSGAGDLTPDGAAFVNSRRGTATPAEPATARRRGSADAPVDLLTQIAKWGGLRDNEGNDFAQSMSLADRKTRAGKVLREDGLGVDQLGEKLWDAGWFGPPSVAERPTLDEVIDIVEQAARGDKLWHPEERFAIEERQRQRDAGDGSDEISWMIDSAAEQLGIEPDPAMRAEADAAIRHGEEPHEALIGAVNSRLADETAHMAREASEAGQTMAPGTEMTPADWDVVAKLLAEFDDPTGQGTIAQVEAIEHDLRAGVTADPELAVRLDAEGGTGKVADVLHALDEEKRVIDALRACMAPQGETA
jgi:GNAT superfamily N-acetyltransferase